ncbi:DUF1876 domain-containing protein [Nonomuraea fastidiosa]|jgi:hypothetical protein|uniref:DUF1876 domain-containing protein n=1 Tax=Nonomuraea TaxID=83681 RepID=UPI003250DDD0
METKEWIVRIALDEVGDDTSARATLTTTGGQRVEGRGHARRNPSDPAVPRIGDELAVSRALSDLAGQLAAMTNRDISESMAAVPTSRSW